MDFLHSAVHYRRKGSLLKCLRQTNGATYTATTYPRPNEVQKLQSRRAPSTASFWGVKSSPETMILRCSARTTQTCCYSPLEALFHSTATLPSLPIIASLRHYDRQFDPAQECISQYLYLASYEPAPASTCYPSGNNIIPPCVVPQRQIS